MIISCQSSTYFTHIVVRSWQARAFLAVHSCAQTTWVHTRVGCGQKSDWFSIHWKISLVRQFAHIVGSVVAGKGLLAVHGCAQTTWVYTRGGCGRKSDWFSIHRKASLVRHFAHIAGSIVVGNGLFAVHSCAQTTRVHTDNTVVEKTIDLTQKNRKTGMWIESGASSAGTLGWMFLHRLVIQIGYKFDLVTFAWIPRCCCCCCCWLWCCESLSHCLQFIGSAHTCWFTSGSLRGCALKAHAYISNLVKTEQGIC